MNILIIIRGIIFTFIVAAAELWAVANFLQSGQDWADKRGFTERLTQISPHYKINGGSRVDMERNNGPDLHKMARTIIIEQSDDGSIFDSGVQFDCLKTQIKYSSRTKYDKDGHLAGIFLDGKDSNTWYTVDGELLLVMDAACTQMKDVHWHPLVAYNILKPRIQ